MSRSPVPLRVAALRMRDDNIGSLLVLENGRLVGALTERDIVIRVLADGTYREDAPVRRAISVEIVSCFKDQTLDEAEQLMAQHQVRRLPVLDRKHKLAGVVSRSDLPGAPASRQSYRVTFYKNMATSQGDPRTGTFRQAIRSRSSFSRLFAW